jgi:ribosome-binding factor A
MARRTQQVADTIQRILGDIIQNDVKDPRIGFATVVRVEVSPDLHYAWVRISVMGDETQRAETMEGLNRAKGFLRRRLAEEMNYLRSVPELRLVLDTSLDYSMHIDALLQEVARQRDESGQSGPDET